MRYEQERYFQSQIMSDTEEQPSIKKPTGFKRYGSLFRRAAEQVAIDEVETKGFRESFQELQNISLGRRARAAAGMRIIYNFIPDRIKDSARTHLQYTNEQLPFNPDEYILSEKIGHGGMNDVFLLESTTDRPSYVLKVLIDALGEKDVNKLTAFAAQQKEDFDNISKLFETIPGLVPPEYFAVIHGPRNNTPAVVTIQPFIGEQVRDIFEEEEQLAEIVSQNPVFRGQLQGFLQILENNDSLLDYGLDLYGKCNLAIVGEQGSERLLLLDPHSISHENRQEFYKNEINRRVNMLRNVVSDVQSTTDSEA